MITPASVVANPGLNNHNLHSPNMGVQPGISNHLFYRQKPNPPLSANPNQRIMNQNPTRNIRPVIRKQVPKTNKTLSRTDPYSYFLTPDIHPVTEDDDFIDASLPYLNNNNNKKFFTTLPTTFKYKNNFFDHAPTSIKYIYKKTKDRKKKHKHKKHEDDEHGHSWFHDWNPFGCEEEGEEHSKEDDEDDEEGGEEEESGGYSSEETEFSIMRRKYKHKLKKKKKWILKILFGLLVFFGIKCLLSRYFFAFFPAFFTTTARDEVPLQDHIEDEGVDDFDRTQYISERQLNEYRSFFSPCYEETKIDITIPSLKNRVKRIINYP